MKFKTDFVTNSSSTSFILISQDSITETEFADLMGVPSESDFYQIVEDLFNQIQTGLEDIDYAYTKGYFKDTYDNFEKFVTSEFSRTVYQKVVEAKDQNKKIMVGHLSSESESGFACFVCCDCFEEENEKIYFNYTNSFW